MGGNTTTSPPSARLFHPLVQTNEELVSIVRRAFETQSPSPTCQQMLDRIVENRIHRARDKFIDAIRPGDICSLASSYHDNDPCDFFLSRRLCSSLIRASVIFPAMLYLFQSVAEDFQ